MFTSTYTIGSLVSSDSILVVCKTDSTMVLEI